MHLIRNLIDRLRPSYGQKLFALATIPLVLAVAAIALLVANQSRALAEREIADLEKQLIAAKRAELTNYMSLARTAISSVYGNALPDDQEAKTRVTQILSSMLYGQEGYFMVFDYDGNNLVAPRNTALIEKNWAGMTDTMGTPVVEPLIEKARFGAGYHSFLWPRPTTGSDGQMMAYSLGLQDWKWAIVTGVFIDDVLQSVAAARANIEARNTRTFRYIGLITLAALLLVFGSGLVINIRERRLADAKLKALTQRIFDTQEEERGRVARELHDSISQILIGVRYALDLTRRRIAKGDPRAQDNLNTGAERLSSAIQEVRRISRDLRPGVLDDLGLGPALHALTEEFQTRTGILVDLETVVFRNRLDQDSRIALYRIAQEALTNIERHADASKVAVHLFGHKSGATLRISDNGTGIPSVRNSPGIGLRNMQERCDQLDGHLTISSSTSGTIIEAQVPLTHILPPASVTAPRSLP
jgi:two-component system, NarL family, sensor kinase